MTQPDPLLLALRRLNDAVYAAIMAGRDTTKYPMLDRQTLREMATVSDKLVEGHLEELRQSKLAEAQQ